MTYCTNCGHPNPWGANFCSQCGTPLSTPGEQTQPPGDQVGRQSSRTADTTRMQSTPSEEQREGEGLDADDEAAVQALPSGSALLIVRRGANAGSRFLLDTDSTTAGRRHDGGIVLDDISVSRRHAVFTRTESGVVVKDVGSLNGTYVNQKLVDQQLLRSGDEVQIGKFRLVFYNAPQ